MSAFTSLKILLVDDNPHMRAIAAAVLQSAGVRDVREATDGATAFSLIQQHPIDIAIVDFNMFPVDGVQFTRTVRTHPQSPNIYLPIIMMTGHSERSRVYEARDAGVTEFIVKPITAKAVLDRLNAVIMRPRPFIRTDTYFGPCRRRRDDANFSGPYRRSSDQSLTLV